MKLIRFIALLIFASLFASGLAQAGGGPIHRLSVQVHVTSAVDGTPLSNARVLVWSIEEPYNPILEAEKTTEIGGSLTMDIETTRQACLVYVLYDDPYTEGVDTMPAVEKIDASLMNHEIEFSLSPASSIILEGPLRLVDSATNIEDYIYQVLDSGSERPMRIGSFDLYYGTGLFGQNYFLRLDSNMIIVPSDTVFELKLIPSFVMEKSTLRGWPLQRIYKYQGAGHREILVDGGGRFILSRGEALKLDVREFTVTSDLRVVEGLLVNLENSLKTKDDQGFYTVSERHELEEIRGLKDAAAASFSVGLLEDAYITARQAYLAALNLRYSLLNMELEASISMKELVAFVAMTSVAFTYLFFEGRSRRIVFSILLYAAMLFYLYMIYPGSNVITADSFVTVSAVSLLAVFLLIYLLPRVAGGAKLEEGLPFLASLGSLFSMAKRGLLRRRLRFILTLTSILILSMSFVALTSASSGYGLIYEPQEWARVKRSGLVVKQLQYAPISPLMKGWFHEVTDDIVDWIQQRGGVLAVARKAESYPNLKPYGFVGSQPIYGVVGVETSEPLLPDILACLADGDFAGDGDVVLVSDSALNALGGAIGDTIALGDVELRIAGTFDQRIMEITDLNGELFAPNMMIDLTPGSGPTIVVQPCDYESIVITRFELARKIHKDVHVSRIAAVLEEGVDIIKMAKSLALERGVRVWASTGGEVFAAHVGEYFVGKGLPLLIPWVIVILNVFMTMINAMYERRGEMAILSSVGLNPNHIAGMFVAEASMTGVIGGGFGYLIGLGLYPLMSLLSSAPLVHQKISAIWSLGAIGVAAAAATVGVAVAVKGSVVLTPSLERRWALANSPRTHTEPWVIPIPARIEADEFEDFMAFMKRILMAHRDRTSIPNITSIREGKGGAEGSWRTLSFWYREGDTGIGGASASCVLHVYDRGDGSFYTTELRSYGPETDIRRSGNFIRALVIKWNTEQGKNGAGPLT